MKKKREEARRSVRVARDTTRLELQGSKDVGTCRDLQSRNYGYTIDNDTAQTRARARALLEPLSLAGSPTKSRDIRSSASYSHGDDENRQHVANNYGSRWGNGISFN